MTSNQLTAVPTYTPVIVGDRNRFGCLDGIHFHCLPAWMVVALTHPNLKLSGKIRDMVKGHNRYGVDPLFLALGIGLLSVPIPEFINFATLELMAEMIGYLKNNRVELKKQAEDEVKTIISRLDIEESRGCYSGISRKLSLYANTTVRVQEAAQNHQDPQIIKPKVIAAIERNYQLQRDSAVKEVIEELDKLVERFPNPIFRLKAAEILLSEIEAGINIVDVEKKMIEEQLLNSESQQNETTVDTGLSQLERLLIIIRSIFVNPVPKESARNKISLELDLEIKKKAAEIYRLLAMEIKGYLKKLNNEANSFDDKIEKTIAKNDYVFENAPRCPSGKLLLRKEDFRDYYEKTVRTHLPVIKTGLRKEVAMIVDQFKDPFPEIEKLCRKTVTKLCPKNVRDFIEKEMTPDDAIDAMEEAVKASEPRVPFNSDINTFNMRRICAVPELFHGSSLKAQARVAAERVYGKTTTWIDSSNERGIYSPSPFDVVFIQACVISGSDLNLDDAEKRYQNYHKKETCWADYPYDLTMPGIKISLPEAETLLAKAIVCKMIRENRFTGGIYLEHQDKKVRLSNSLSDQKEVEAAAKVIAGNYNAAVRIWFSYRQLMKEDPDSLWRTIENDPIIGYTEAFRKPLEELKKEITLVRSTFGFDEDEFIPLNTSMPDENSVNSIV